MGVLLVFMVLILAGFLGVTLWLGRETVRRADAEVDVPETPNTTVLRYEVPEGQDPAAVMAALAAAGLPVSSEHVADRRIVVVTLEWDAVLDREDVRTLIGDAGTTIQDGAPVARKVRFTDEVDGTSRSRQRPRW